MPFVDIKVGPRTDIARGRGLRPARVDAFFVAGVWAAHATFCGPDNDNTVSHIPSGLAVADRMTTKQAVDLVRLLSLSLDVRDIEPKLHEEIARREVAAIGGRFLKRGEP